MVRKSKCFIQIFIFIGLIIINSACTSAVPEMYELANLDSKLFPSTPKYKVLSDGSIVDGNDNAVNSPMWNARDFFYIPGLQKTNRDFENLDPRLISVSQKPDSGELWGLMSYGQIVKVNTDGSVDFNATCPFTAGCEGWVRFQSFSAGKKGNLYLLDNEGRVFNARDLSKVLYTASSNVTQVVYY